MSTVEEGPDGRSTVASGRDRGVPAGHRPTGSVKDQITPAAFQNGPRGRRWAAAVRRRGDRIGDALVGPARAPIDTTVAERSNTQAHLLACLVVLFYLARQLLTRDSTLLSGEMWAEMARDYYPASVTGSLWERLTALDFGYIPLPQRLSAVAFDVVGVPASAIPFAFNWTAVLLGGGFVSLIVLPVFRSVVHSDMVRFGLAIMVLMVPEFETRTFLNFTYFAVVPIAMVTALALVDRRGRLPGWTWVIPLFMMSKPGVLTVLPAMVLVAAVSAPRFRRITAVSVLVALVQLVRLAVSQAGGKVPSEVAGSTLIERIGAGIGYSLGFLGRWLVRPDVSRVDGLVLLGVGGLVVMVAVTLLIRGPGGALIVVGLGMWVCTLMLDAVTVPVAFSPDLSLLANVLWDRRFIVAVIGTFFMVTGVIVLVTETLLPRLLPVTRARGAALAVVAVVLLGSWFQLSGWRYYATGLIPPPVSPAWGNSQWVDQATALDTPGAAACVPADPYGWFYGRDCSMLAIRTAVDAAYESVPPGTRIEGAGPGVWTVTVPAPTVAASTEIASVAVLVRPEGAGSLVSGQAILTRADGTTVVLTGEKEMAGTGGLLQFVDFPATFTSGVVSVTLAFDEPVSVAVTPGEDGTLPVMLWMGR